MNSPSKKINTLPAESYDLLMNELELKIAKLLKVKDENNGSILMNLRDHLIEVYHKIGISLLKKFSVYD